MGIHLEKNKIQKDICTLSSLQHFTIARTRKQPKCPPTDERIKKMGYVYTHNHKKEWNWVICRDIDDSYIRSEVSQKEKEILCMNACMWSLPGTDEPICRQEETHRCREQMAVRAGWMGRLGLTCALPCSRRELAIWCRELGSELCGDLGWGGTRGRAEREGIYVCTQLIHLLAEQKLTTL